MSDMQIEFQDTKELARADILELYEANDWSSAKKPDQLHAALQNSHSVITAWQGQRLVGLANAISDGHLVVYYPHVVVHPEFHRQGVGRGLMMRLMERYQGFHQHAVLADPDAVGFYEAFGFSRSNCPSMWIYDGQDH